MSIHDEHLCTYISTCGFSLICDQPPKYNRRNISYNISFDTKRGDSIYVHCRDLVSLSKILPQFKNPIVILVGGDDNLFPSDYPREAVMAILESENVLAIYSQNQCIVGHEKCKHLPIGLDYHTLNWESGNHLWGRTGLRATQQEMVLKACQTKMKPLRECNATPIVTNFQLAMKTPPRRAALRKPIYEALKDKAWMKWLDQMSRKDFWLSLSDVAFVVCAAGQGLDTHRAYEVLCLGRIPIVQKLPINEVYRELPVWEVEDWNEFAKFTDQDFKYKLTEFIDKWNSYNFERLRLDFWRGVLEQYKK